MRNYNADEIYESAHETKTAWLIPDTQVSSKHRVRRYGIDNHPKGSINLSERINRAEHGRLARRPWATIHFFFLS